MKQVCQVESKEFFGVQCSIDHILDQYTCLKEWINQKDGKRLITFLNPHVYNNACKDTLIWEVINNSDIVSIDGVGVKAAIWLRSQMVYKRVVMTHLFEYVLYSKELNKTSALLIGASKTEVEAARLEMNQLSEGLHIEKSYHGFSEIDFYVSEVKKNAHIGIVLVGMGTPKSEYLMHELNKLERNIIIWHIGGGTIKCFAHTKQRSPVWLNRIGLEWLHRFVKEPSIVGRYLIGIPVFIRNIMRAGKRK